MLSGGSPAVAERRVRRRHRRPAVRRRRLGPGRRSADRRDLDRRRHPPGRPRPPPRPPPSPTRATRWCGSGRMTPPATSPSGPRPRSGSIAPRRPTRRWPAARVAGSTSASMLVSASGSTDGAGSGIAGYQYETSTDGGSTWSSPAAGASPAVADEGETLVRFRAVDNAGPDLRLGAADGAARSQRALGAVAQRHRLGMAGAGAGHRRPPPARSTPAAPGSTTTSTRLSTDGGTSWTAAAPGRHRSTSPAEGETLVRFRAVDAAGNASGWTARPRADRPHRADRSDRARRLASWLNAASASLTASGATGHAGQRHRPLRVRDVDGRRHDLVAGDPGAAASITDEGETAGALPRRGRCRPDLRVGCRQTVRLDRTAPSAPSVSGLTPGWQSVASVTATASGSTDARSGLDHYEYEISADGGDDVGCHHRRQHDRRDRRGPHQPALPRRRCRGQRLGLDVRRRLARSHAADRPVAGRWLAGVALAGERVRHRERLGRRRLRPRPLRVRDIHRRRLDLVGAAPPASLAVPARARRSSGSARST